MQHRSSLIRRSGNSIPKPGIELKIRDSPRQDRDRQRANSLT